MSLPCAGLRMLAAICLLAGALVFARSLFPGFRHFEQRLLVFRAHGFGHPDTIRCIFPVGLRVLHVDLLSYRENAWKWNLVRGHDGYAPGTNVPARRYSA